MLTASFVINRSVKLEEGFETSDLRREFVPICLVKTKPLFSDELCKKCGSVRFMKINLEQKSINQFILH